MVVNNGVNKAANIGVNNIKEEMKMENINNNGVINKVWDEMANVDKIIRDFKSNPIKYVVDIDITGIDWGEEVDELYYEIYSQFRRDYGDNLIEGAEVLKSGMYSDKIIEIAEEFGVNVNKEADIKVNNVKEEMNMQNINNNGMSLEEAYSVIKDFHFNPSKYVVDIESMGIGWGEQVDKLWDEIYTQHCRDYRDDIIMGAELLKSGMYSDRIIEIAAEHGVKKSATINELKVIKLDCQRFITQKDLWEPIGAHGYTLPLKHIIDNLIYSYIENDELDEEVMNHTDEIIMKLINHEEFIYTIKDGELHEVEGVNSKGIEEVLELWLPYLIELEQAADELLGFWKVVNNLDLSDREKDEMKGHVFTDELYIFVHRYCREIWWDGGSN